MTFIMFILEWTFTIFYVTISDLCQYLFKRIHHFKNKHIASRLIDICLLIYYHEPSTELYNLFIVYF
jgi:hypothetical protein